MEKKIKQKYFLLPSNIIFLELISRIDTKFLKNQIIVDIPSGLGNFRVFKLFYTQKLFNWN